MLCSLASLDRSKIEAVEALEKKIGKTLLAYSCKEFGIASVKDDELKEIRDLEARLGLSLVAVAP